MPQREIFLPSGGEKTGGGESPFKKPWKPNSDNEIKVTTLNQDLIPKGVQIRGEETPYYASLRAGL